MQNSLGEKIRKSIIIEGMKVDISIINAIQARSWHGLDMFRGWMTIDFVKES